MEYSIFNGPEPERISPMAEASPEKMKWTSVFCPLIVLALFVGSLVSSFWAYSKLVALKDEFLPDVSFLKDHYPVAVAKEGRKIIFRFQKERPKTWKALNQISKEAVAAVLTAEDGGFYLHKGYEPESIRKAWNENLKVRKFRRGGSTITQQVVKNLFLTPEKTMSRKFREILLAVEVEKTLSKKQILEIYLNIAEWGRDIYGIEQASHFYFSKASVELSPKEGAVLAYLLPNPQKYGRPLMNSGELSDFGMSRVNDILEKLWKTGRISDEEYTSRVGSPDVPLSL